MISVLYIAVFSSGVAVFVLFLIVSGSVVDHLCVAVCAEHQSCQWVCFSPLSRLMLRLADFLDGVPCVLIHNEFLCIFEENPVFWIDFSGTFVFVGIFMCRKLTVCPVYSGFFNISEMVVAVQVYGLPISQLP